MLPAERVSSLPAPNAAPAKVDASWLVSNWHGSSAVEPASAGSVLLTAAVTVGMGVAVDWVVAVGWGVAVGKGVLDAAGAVGTLVTAGVGVMQAESSTAITSTEIPNGVRAELFLLANHRRSAAAATRKTIDKGCKSFLDIVISLSSVIHKI